VTDHGSPKTKLEFEKFEKFRQIFESPPGTVFFKKLKKNRDLRGGENQFLDGPPPIGPGSPLEGCLRGLPL
jgi:hypothetical protein